MLEYLAGLRKIFDEDAMTGPTTKSIAERLTYLFDSSVAGASPSGGSIASILKAIAQGTTGVPLVGPALATGFVTATTGTAGALGTWVEVVAASTWASHFLTHIYAGFGGTSQGQGSYFQIQVGAGAAGSEVVLGTWMFVHNTNSSSTMPYQPSLTVWPWVQIPANARVAVRVGGAQTSLNLALGVCPRPLA